MTGDSKRRKKGSKLADWKRQQSEHTHEHLDAALDRFEAGDLSHVPKNQKLTRLALAKEAGVARDTPFSRYRSGHAKASEYRFPEIVRRFELLRKKSSEREPKRSAKEEITELRGTVGHLDDRLKASRRVINAQDIRIVELELKNRDLEKLFSEAVAERQKLEKELKSLRRERFKNVSK
jgi:hypothetical protein